MFIKRSSGSDLEDTVIALQKRVEELERNSYLYTYTAYAFREVKTPIDRVIWMILDKLGLSLKRHPATQETFTLEDNPDVIRVQMHSL